MAESKQQQIGIFGWSIIQLSFRMTANILL